MTQQPEGLQSGELGQVVVGKDNVRRWLQCGEKVGGVVDLPLSEVDPGLLERGHDQLGVAWIVFNQDQGERVGLHAHRASRWSCPAPGDEWP